MKRTLLIILSLASGFLASAQTQDDILSKIAASTARTEKVGKRFQEIRSLAGQNKTKVTLEGMLTYDPSDKLSMVYDNGEQFLIDGDTMTIKRDGTLNVFNTSKNLMMRGLSHALLFSFSGKFKDLALEQSANLTASKDGSEYIVELTAQKKAVRGYSRIEVHFDVRTGALVSMVMDEFTGASTFYTFVF